MPDLKTPGGETPLQILKSTRHAKISGDFAEGLVLYWLSKYGFECARIDHTGIDLIAADSARGQRIGISVKCRCRILGSESESLTLDADNFSKAQNACNAFGCTPYFAIVVDALDRVQAFILPMRKLLELCPKRKRAHYWSMSKASIARYRADPEIFAFEMQTNTLRWFTVSPGPAKQI